MCESVVIVLVWMCVRESVVIVLVWMCARESVVLVLECSVCGCSPIGISNLLI